MLILFTKKNWMLKTLNFASFKKKKKKKKKKKGGWEITS